MVNGSLPTDFSFSHMQLANDFDAWRHMTTTNFTIVTDGELFTVHKDILRVRCPYFVGLFAMDCVETKNSVLDVMNFDALVVGLVLDFIYTGGVALTSVTVASTLRLAANYYHLAL